MFPAGGCTTGAARLPYTVRMDLTTCWLGFHFLTPGPFGSSGVDFPFIEIAIGQVGREDEKKQNKKPVYGGNMKVWLAPVLLAVCVACGGGGGGSSAPAPAPSTHVPSISNLVFTTPMTVAQNSGGGAVTMSGTFNFIDSGGDITTGVLEGVDNSGNVLSTHPFPLTGMSGITAGTAYIVASVSTATSGNFPFKFHVVDAASNISNDLSGTYTVTALLPAISQPSVSTPPQPETAAPIEFKIIETGLVN